MENDKSFLILLQEARDAVRKLSDEDARIVREVMKPSHVALQTAKTPQEIDDVRDAFVDIVTELETR